MSELKKTKEELQQEFKEYYKQEIIPVLNQYEHGRGMDNSTIKNFFIPFGLIFFFIFLVVICISLGLILLGIISFIGVFASFAYIFIAASKDGNPNVKKEVQKTKTYASVSYSYKVDLDYEKPLKQKLTQGFINVFGCKFMWTKGFEKDEDKQKTENKLKSLNIFPKIGEIRFDDVITGIYNDVYVQIAELETGMRSFDVALGCVFMLVVLEIFGSVFFAAIAMKNSGMCFMSVLLFLVFMFFLLKSMKINLANGKIKGLAVSFKIPKKFSGHTFIIENAVSNAKLHLKDINKYEAVTLESADFNKKFKVYSNDQIEARYLLTTSFMQRFENIQMAFNAQYIRAEFKDGELTLFISADEDLFRMGSLFEKSSYSTFQQVFEEIYSVLNLTTYFKLDENTGL